MRFLLFLLYKEIDPSCNSEDGKTLIKVNDTSQYLKISAKCEIIQSYCFSKLKSLSSFTFEDNPNLTTIGYSSFKECSNLTIVNLSICSKLTTIDNYAFYQCEKVTEILFPNGLSEIGICTFYNNYLVKFITIPATVKTMNSVVFDGLRRLENITFMIGLDSMVFSSCKIPSSFQIPENVSRVHGQAFDGCEITNISVHPLNQYLYVENNIIYSAN
ncbi:surface antigen BspA-like [Trichomonas vaginalis G3]|uniref:Surface antigen BspA-like n=1 Tax=Trichomonas vaginalis (strain ATCC PRA-98 / G3) TaxID=412133 RepID=A2DGC5_TRIV3|nr:ribonuclease inhibitor domain-containing protein [Trichomonas vaginalis G3]EAY20521.1 surface antigen BspA-like [Trichomonas vaginalis G3]KAI5488302.1 ribonuclease inhibitor domain-containing protein [Trichomonas vaginalis G3]|eukprot:XP_001581507.1 surface antigen BspA-like [Trichomonas vaginalis G3]